MPGVRVIEMNGDESVMSIMELCDPRIELETERQFVKFWTTARRAIENFIAVYGPRSSSSNGEINPNSSFPLPFSLPSTPFESGGRRGSGVSFK